MDIERTIADSLFFGLPMLMFMMFVAWFVGVIAVRFIPYPLARAVAVMVSAILFVPLLLPSGTWGYGLLFLAGSVVLVAQLALRQRDGD